VLGKVENIKGSCHSLKTSETVARRLASQKSSPSYSFLQRCLNIAVLYRIFNGYHHSLFGCSFNSFFHHSQCFCKRFHFTSTDGKQIASPKTRLLLRVHQIGCPPDWVPNWVPKPTQFVRFRPQIIRAIENCRYIFF